MPNLVKRPAGGRSPFGHSAEHVDFLRVADDALGPHLPLTKKCCDRAFATCRARLSAKHDHTTTAEGADLACDPTLGRLLYAIASPFLYTCNVESAARREELHAELLRRRRLLLNHAAHVESSYLLANAMPGQYIAHRVQLNLRATFHLAHSSAATSAANEASGACVAFASSYDAKPAAAADDG